MNHIFLTDRPIFVTHRFEDPWVITGSHRLFGGSRWREMDTPEAGDGSGRAGPRSRQQRKCRCQRFSVPNWDSNWDSKWLEELNMA